jgi:FKBP-type peptidyl-prolyl cis-trans isomerase
MKQKILYTLLLFCVVGLYACKKNKQDVDIKQYDDQQIQNYISSHGLTGMQRDMTSGDTTGIYYQILSPGNPNKRVGYSDSVSLVFSIRSFDGKFVDNDTIGSGHVTNFLGHITQNQIPYGVELAIVNLLKYKGGRMRLLLPSHLAYGSAGYGTGSSSGNNRIAGNQCLDYYINLIDNQKTYDDQVIKSYISANNLSGFIPAAVGNDTLDSNNKPQNYIYYKITKPGVGAPITSTSSVSIQYTVYLLNGMITSDQYNAVDGSGVTVNIADSTLPGLAAGLTHTLPGSKISILVPSKLAYGSGAFSDGTIPVNSCLRYEINVISAQ